MAIMERDVVLTGMDAQGNPTMDFPVTRLDLIEGRAPVQQSMKQTDHIPLVVDGEVRMVPVSAIQAMIDTATGVLVPNTRKINGKALSADVTLSAADVKARPDSWTPSAADVGARPSSWIPTAADVGALPSNGTAAAASKLATARTIQTNLGSTTAASFDGTGNVTPGVTGTLPLAKGGTGATAAASAIYNLVNALTALASTGLATGDYLPLLDASAGTGKKVTLTNLKTWLQNQGIGARIATGSYTGTGTYGADNPCTLTFNFSPQLVFIYRAEGTGSQNGFFAAGAKYSTNTYHSLDTTSFSSGYCVITWTNNGQTLSYYCGSKKVEASQLNNANAIYGWVAFG